MQVGPNLKRILSDPEMDPGILLVDNLSGTGVNFRIGFSGMELNHGIVDSVSVMKNGEWDLILKEGGVGFIALVEWLLFYLEDDDFPPKGGILVSFFKNEKVRKVLIFLLSDLHYKDYDTGAVYVVHTIKTASKAHEVTRQFVKYMGE
jgi:hypothetical protein